MKKNVIFCMVVLLIFSACKKDKDEPAVSLAGKWTVDNTTIKEHINGTVNTDIEPGNGATIDFQDNGHVVLTYPGLPIESLVYVIKPDSKVEIDGDTFEIRNLSNATVTLYLREDYSPGEYDEVFINLKR
jgi:hypothetical protein